MDMENALTSSFVDIADKVSAAMEMAINEYGSATIDLALLAYRAEAWQSLIWGFLSIAFLAAIITTSKKLSQAPHLIDSDATVARFLIVFFSFVVSVPFTIVAILHLSSPVVWLAAFGYPELLIATRALQAAGLL